ncbi:para-aminobenzoate synthetase component 1 [Pedobacter cryoconitis]|uniref:Para-aminobenzoate synthetase component 1 n=1 Tax=Pedobacter cryoconitis TaxID=188932 RepID=A0A7W9E2E6_9SPHI|nr:anthranilate synthase component I family protein [Pedobacter cryoconitis]MBB5639204.1 para-aminobenzoate synthetase component 1 [Pedobacter cryoconitis]MBB6274823.1 para-aminobenzoate synthetase component 1 [Pedobacter cryoconitis]
MNPQELISFKQKALQWANQFEVCCCFDSNEYTDPYSRYDFLLAAGAKHQLNAATGDAFKALQTFSLKHPGWLFGLLSYDLKNEIEDLTSAHENKLDFPDLFFFVPQYLIAVKNGNIEILAGTPDLLDTIHKIRKSAFSSPAPLEMKPKMNKETYLDKVNELRAHIARGDIYEVNFCQEFFAENASINPYEVYLNLNELSPTPFSGFFKLDSNYILSASPERFMCKRGSRLISQPIKGTAKRSKDQTEDELIKIALKNDLKEQAENVMIVDLVRNDLTKSAVPGTVQVDELFGIYSFPQVHQMISTISCELDPALHPVEAIQRTFPMGSMTGAPKLRAMELIEETECSRRGMYSGTFGYFDPEGDFDFNVVIRSILYNEQKNYLSFQVGGAITFASSAEAEYEECMLKASAIIKTLKGSH